MVLWLALCTLSAFVQGISMAGRRNLAIHTSKSQLPANQTPCLASRQLTTHKYQQVLDCLGQLPMLTRSLLTPTRFWLDKLMESPLVNNYKSATDLTRPFYQSLTATFNWQLWEQHHTFWLLIRSLSRRSGLIISSAGLTLALKMFRVPMCRLNL